MKAQERMFNAVANLAGTVTFILWCGILPAGALILFRLFGPGS